jgi:hypothetical protein
MQRLTEHDPTLSGFVCGEYNTSYAGLDAKPLPRWFVACTTISRGASSSCGQRRNRQIVALGLICLHDGTITTDKAEVGSSIAINIYLA